MTLRLTIGTIIPQEVLNGRCIPYPLGIGLGGSSAVNCLVYTRGSADDIDKWVELSGDEGWSWDRYAAILQEGMAPTHRMIILTPLYRVRNSIPFLVDGHNTTGQYLPAFHGTDGVIGVSHPRYP
ncbi:uncharacterized protein EV420DRAFT_345939 [Desarmillaria tabescens]|uniref:Glucose-methanol-choline oxidoreductase N-terminal domain-containing protein n=1 Tax=Armillaria tabescens TaxID=1929756 RepID=A0AA39N5V0_ARMTA|nr:uncharacterized protein EV420DRAFT_345939 [Desarmillaria tabescens]KAK0459017.1 hypothetical protein EV420DRAFT_345939 [Desarmillaria tabescens]